MLVGMAIGIHLYNVVNQAILVPLYGGIIVAVALKNLFMKQSNSSLPAWIAIPVLLGAGIIHGMFASGGALLVVYLVATFRDKDSFRANVASVWSILNLVLMFNDYSTMRSSSSSWHSASFRSYLPSGSGTRFMT